jgi:hypothetical protein
LFDKFEYYIDYIAEKANDETVNNSLDEEKDIKPERTDDEIERENLNKDDQPIEQDDEEQPVARFDYLINQTKIYRELIMILDHVIYRN